MIDVQDTLGDLVTANPSRARTLEGLDLGPKNVMAAFEHGIDGLQDFGPQPFVLTAEIDERYLHRCHALCSLRHA